jgi:hypothetical protein
MPGPLQAVDGSFARDTVDEFVRGVVGALPEVVSGLLFVSLAYVAIKVALSLLRATLDRIYPAEQDLVVELFVTVVGVFLWFGAALSLLKILGMGDVAASLGTATGFVALGVSYALSNMIADTVAGVYLLRDPDYNLGDTVTAAGETGVVRDIGLRKTRIEREDGDLVIVANSKVDAGWVWQAPVDESEAADDEAEPAPERADETAADGADTLVANTVVSDTIYADEVVADSVVDADDADDADGSEVRRTESETETADQSAVGTGGEASGVGAEGDDDASGPDRRDDAPDDRTEERTDDSA